MREVPIFCKMVSDVAGSRRSTETSLTEGRKETRTQALVSYARGMNDIVKRTGPLIDQVETLFIVGPPLIPRLGPEPPGTGHHRVMPADFCSMGGTVVLEYKLILGLGRTGERSHNSRFLNAK